MGFSSDTTDLQMPGGARSEDRVIPPSLPPRRSSNVRPLVMFALTVFSTLWAGHIQYASFYFDPANPQLPWSSWELFLRGAWYSGAILAILGAHELGHYYACKYYKVDASPPHFLPMIPMPLLPTGTLGAFIRIRQQVRSKRELFDIGIAGPIAGFLVAVPVLLFGASLSRMVELPPEGPIAYYGEPLLVQFAIWLNFGTRPEGFDVVLHPMAFAGWFGLLATALNLFPIGQLDGGHISYAVLGRKSTLVTLCSVAALIALTFFSMSWLLWAALMVIMLVTFGPRHPSTFDEAIPLDPARRWLAVFALFMFVVCFTPTPLGIIELGE